MATRQHRISEFSNDAPLGSEPVELLCEDHCGTYSLPYACRWVDGVWRNATTGAAISAAVVGWRTRKA
jgi:hypothetical protein